MVHLVWVIGAMIAALGVMAVVAPQKMQGFVRFMGKEKRYYLAAIIRLVIAVIFLIFARDVRQTNIILILGLLFLIGGILVLVLGADKIKSMINWFISKPMWLYRLWGLVAVLFAALIIYAGWPKAA